MYHVHSAAVVVQGFRKRCALGVEECRELIEGAGVMGVRVEGAGGPPEEANGLDLRVLGFQVSGFGFRVHGAGCRVQGAGCRMQGAGCRDQELTA